MTQEQEKHWDVLAEKQAAAIERDGRVVFQDAMVRAVHKVMAEFEAQPEQEPWCMKMNGCKTKCEDCPVEVAQRTEQEPAKDWVASHNAICALLRQAHDALALTSYPMKRKWVGLTEEEIGDEYVRFDVPKGGFNRFEYAVRATEAKLKEKNT